KPGPRKTEAVAVAAVAAAATAEAAAAVDAAAATAVAAAAVDAAAATAVDAAAAADAIGIDCPSVQDYREGRGPGGSRPSCFDKVTRRQRDTATMHEQSRPCRLVAPSPCPDDVEIRLNGPIMIHTQGWSLLCTRTEALPFER